MAAAPALATPFFPLPAAPLPTHVQRIAVFGPDDRQPLPDRYKGLRGAIGLFYNDRARTVCTAFCVAPDTIATAGHCIYRTAGQAPPPVGAFWFTRPSSAQPNAARIAGSRAQSAGQHVLAGSIRLSVQPPIDAVHDWALVRLERPVCAGNVLPVRELSIEEIAEEAKHERLFQVSYHRDYANWKLAYSQPCGLGKAKGAADWSRLARDFTDPLQLILHTCDTGGASSGSPLLVEGPNGPEVVGVNVGTYVQAQVLMQAGEVLRRYKADPVANTGVNARVFASKLGAFREAHILPSGPQLRALQEQLRVLHFFAARPDGKFGLALRSAILAYEREAGLPELGLATTALLRRLEEANPHLRRGGLHLMSYPGRP